jgi:hypothetical protein
MEDTRSPVKPCSLEYEQSNPSGFPYVAALVLTKCKLPTMEDQADNQTAMTVHSLPQDAECMWRAVWCSGPVMDYCEYHHMLKHTHY